MVDLTVFNFHHRVVETDNNLLLDLSDLTLTFTIGWLKHVANAAPTPTTYFNFHHRVVETEFFCYSLRKIFIL